MFGFMRDQWVLTKGIREIVIMAERDGKFMPSGREEVIDAILECSRELNIPLKGVSGHEQVMIAIMAFLGIAMGDAALSDGEKWAAEYATRHKRRDLLACKKIAGELIAACA